MKRTKCIVVLTIMLLSQMIYAQFSPGLNSYSIGGRDYDVRTPSDYVASKAYPIVFELHGGGGDKSQQQDQGVVDEQQYIAVYPEGTGASNKIWNTWPQTELITGNADDVAHLTTVYNQVKDTIGVAFDADKVYAYGWSNGGAMAMKMVEKTNLFKAVVIRSMTLIDGDTIPSSARKVPMIFIHGTGDATVPYAGGEGDKPFSPNFMDVKTAVKAWATHNGCVSTPQDIHYLANGNIGEFWFREYANTQVNAPVYLYAIPGAPHATNGGFSRRNNKRTAIRLFKGPRCYGLARYSGSCQN